MHTLKENTKEIINSFVDKNINVYIITGDNKDIAYEIANELSIPLANIYYEAKPEDKLKIIEDLHKHNKNIKSLNYIYNFNNIYNNK